MPYYKKNDINLLFIHIPKTGGTSVETYFSVKYNIPLEKTSLMSTQFLSVFNENCVELSDKYSNFLKNMPKQYMFDENNNCGKTHSLQHCTYKELLMYKEQFAIDFNNINIVSIVRNPYTRILSDLFYFNLINTNSQPEQIYDVIVKYINNKDPYVNGCVFDKHNIPQYLYLLDNDDNISKNIRILRTETLDDDMKQLGYTDFKYQLSVTYRNKIDYFSLLNTNAIKIINEYYKKDFEYFDYKMLAEKPMKKKTTIITKLHKSTPSCAITFEKLSDSSGEKKLMDENDPLFKPGNVDT